MAELDLKTNTISEFHDNLMTYYDLCKVRQEQHEGYWATATRHVSIPEFVIPKETIEDRTILRDREWGTKIKWRDHMLSKGYNKENTKMYYVDHDNLEPALIDVLHTLPIDKPVFSMNIQPPGSVVPAHEDTWRIWYDKFPGEAERHTFEDTVFYIVFISPQEIGHTFSAGTTNIKWGPGDVIEMPYYCKHATSNAGFTNKIAVQCLGLKK